MTTENEIKEKWSALLQYAKEHATGEGLHRGSRWLQDAFEEYLDMSEEVSGYAIGGQPGSQHNRDVLAQKILIELGHHIGGQHLINEAQEAKLAASLKDIAQGQSNYRCTRDEIPKIKRG